MLQLFPYNFLFMKQKTAFHHALNTSLNCRLKFSCVWTSFCFHEIWFSTQIKSKWCRILGKRNGKFWWQKHLSWRGCL